MFQDPDEELHSFNDIPIQIDSPKNEEDDRRISDSINKIKTNFRKKRKRSTTKKKRKINLNQKTKEESKLKKGDTKQSEKRTDNIRRSAFIRLLIFLKVFFMEMFGLNMDSFNCQKDFGTTFGVFKEKMRWEIYQIFCCNKNEKNITNLYQFLEKAKMDTKEKLIFFYFMTRTYEELYMHYIEGNINFSNMQKNNTLRICKFLTLTKAIEEKKKDNYKYIEEFESLSKSMLTDFDTLERISEIDIKKIQKEKYNIDIFEKMRNYFDGRVESNGLGFEKCNENELNVY